MPIKITRIDIDLIEIPLKYELFIIILKIKFTVRFGTREGCIIFFFGG
jgi:hypothetical protein